MEKRIVKISKNKSGGTACGRAESFRLSLPTAWVKAMGLDLSSAELTFDGEKIVVKRSMSVKEFLDSGIAKGHKMKRLCYYNDNTLCSVIVADYSEENIVVENYSPDAVNLPFGKNTAPTWPDYEAFLAERCISRDRFGLREYLESIGLYEYDPIEIIKITEGRMAEDKFHLQVEEYE